MSVLWTSDTCGCKWNMQQIENTDNWEGTAVQTCLAHSTLDEALSSNRFKNDVVNLIKSTLEITENDSREITFTFNENTDDFVFYLNNFSVEDITTVNNLNLNITIG